jgi:molybdopterin/thiamine biosynthesis adenylyltransferase
METLTDNQLTRYARQLLLPQVDLDGQMRLQRSCVLVVGAGGLGCPVTQYLAGAGVGHIVWSIRIRWSSAIFRVRWCIPKRMSEWLK